MKPTKRVLQNATMTATKILRKCVKTLLRINEKNEKLVYKIVSNAPEWQESISEDTLNSINTALRYMSKSSYFLIQK